MKEGDYANGKVEYQSNFRKLLGTAVSNDSGALTGLQLPRAFCFLGFLMEKAPAFQFYASDFLSDENVMLMDNRAVGCYIKLLCVNWKQGSIPSNIEKIARLCGEDGSAMAQLWPSLERCFIPEKNGRLINPRIEKERLKQQRFKEERSAAGKKGARNRWKDKDKNGSAIDLPMAKNSSSSSSSSSKKKKIYVETSDEVRLSKLLLGLIKERKPDFKKPDLQKWAVHIDRMIRLDKRKPKMIVMVIKWAQADTDFWQNNILSTEKLRKQFDQLELKMNQDSDIKTVENTEKAKPLCVKCKKVPAAYEHDKIGWLCCDCWPKGGDK